MANRFRLLALINLAFAVVFLLPLAFSGIAEQQSSGLKITLPKNDQTAELMREVQSATDIAKLRNLAGMLLEMRQVDQQVRSMDTDLINRLFGWLGRLMGACGVILLANAVTIWWLVTKLPGPR